MDLRKMNDAAKVDLCRKYFIVGLFCLPLSPATNTIRKYVTLSAIGAIFWLIIICVWETIFQSYHSKGVAWADYLTFISPVGRV
ncbi:unnamed protein product [Heligmosomoides polygyrus]|uniref:Gamma-secretase subunit PEN-2 n=1 Tax=Heligmosomoides polygyrus TaxID=6339 RepID=A0A183GHV0_HELPZ|nr:unnamed protein product [Heligmosomoides polygyrus]